MDIITQIINLFEYMPIEDRIIFNRVSLIKNSNLLRKKLPKEIIKMHFYIRDLYEGYTRDINRIKINLLLYPNLKTVCINLILLNNSPGWALLNKNIIFTNKNKPIILPDNMNSIKKLIIKYEELIGKYPSYNNLLQSTDTTIERKKEIWIYIFRQYLTSSKSFNEALLTKSFNKALLTLESYKSDKFIWSTYTVEMITQLFFDVISYVNSKISHKEPFILYTISQYLLFSKKLIPKIGDVLTFHCFKSTTYHPSHEDIVGISGTDLIPMMIKIHVNPKLSSSYLFFCDNLEVILAFGSKILIEGIENGYIELFNDSQQSVIKQNCIILNATLLPHELFDNIYYIQEGGDTNYIFNQPEHQIISKSEDIYFTKPKDINFTKSEDIYFTKPKDINFTKLEQNQIDELKTKYINTVAKESQSMLDYANIDKNKTKQEIFENFFKKITNLDGLIYEDNF